MIELYLYEHVSCSVLLSMNKNFVMCWPGCHRDGVFFYSCLYFMCNLHLLNVQMIHLCYITGVVISSGTKFLFTFVPILQV